GLGDVYKRQDQQQDQKQEHGGLKADLSVKSKALFCRSWLAGDADNSVLQVNRGDAIAGKPAPTFDRAAFDFSVASNTHVGFQAAVFLILLLILILILGAPLNHAGRTQVLRSG
ncbi:hypothetical protein QN410_33955, partial [Pseudomonas sp. Bout1]|nr:hypothetical protein [Pseudomonas sp. Bout1]